jgi:hypothetical protein
MCPSAHDEYGAPIDLPTAATMMKKPTARTVSSLATCSELVSPIRFPPRMCTLSPFDTHVELGRDGSGSEGRAEDDTAGLGPEGGAGNGVDDRRGLVVRGLCGGSAAPHLDLA